MVSNLDFSTNGHQSRRKPLKKQLIKLDYQGGYIASFHFPELVVALRRVSHTGALNSQCQRKQDFIFKNFHLKVLTRQTNSCNSAQGASGQYILVTAARGNK